jgi:hypothetical protein
MALLVPLPEKLNCQKEHVRFADKSGADPSHDTFGSMRLVANLWNGLSLTAFSVTAIAILAGGCHRPRSKNDGDTTAISAGSQLSQTLVGSGSQFAEGFLGSSAARAFYSTMRM